MELTSGDKVYGRRALLRVLLGPLTGSGYHGQLFWTVGLNYGWSNRRSWWALALWKSGALSGLFGDNQTG